MLRDTAREEGATKDFLSLSKKVLVTLICVICSFFSTARRTNQEAPPLLSGFWVRRRSRRRGLRNSLRSDSPRPFSSVFLATSPPDKGGIGGSCLYSNPFALWALPLYSFQEHPAMLRDTAGEEGATKDFLSLPKKVLVTLNHFICSFFSTARRTNQEAPPQLSGFWLVATVAVGVCGTRFARTVLALFPPSSLRLHRPIKAESGDLACILTPSPFGHSPYIPCRNTGGEV